MKNKIESVCKAVEAMCSWGMFFFLVLAIHIPWWGLVVVILLTAILIGTTYLEGMVHTDPAFSVREGDR